MEFSFLVLTHQLCISDFDLIQMLVVASANLNFLLILKSSCCFL